MIKLMFITVINNMNNEKKIILTVIILLFFSFSFLFHSEQKQLKTIGENGWWAVYFENPKTEDSSFAIENSGKAAVFYWKEYRF